ncbi:hypothetical protein D1N53_23910, partial [Clostridioides difficile]
AQQGVAYLDDGTMIVVDGGRKYMNETIKVLVTSVLQTPAGRILNATISKEPSGRYYVSLCCTDVDIEAFENTNNHIGLDLG